MKDRNICIYKNTNATFVNLDAGNKFKNKSTDLKPYECQGKSLTPVEVKVSGL
jgi:hypothetical protein